MNSDYNVLKVNIFGTDYPVKGSTDPDYIAKVAGYVDQKMREIDKAASLKPVLKVAILAALNIADELHKEREEKIDLIAKYESRVKNLSDSLSTALYEVTK